MHTSLAHASAVATCTDVLTDHTYGKVKDLFSSNC